MTALPTALIETPELLARLGEPNLKILDASYHIPPSPRDARVEFAQCHIPGARFFDIDAISDPDSHLPHMLPDPESFEAHMAQLGVTSEDTVVVYDYHGIMSAPRAWWMFRYFGHERVHVLNGGLPKWLAENLPTESGAPAQPEQASGESAQVAGGIAGQAPIFKTQVNPQLLCSLAEVQENVEATVSNSSPARRPMVDMRSFGRFCGQDPEPRPGLKRGHIPGSLNAPWGSWLKPDGTLLPPAELEAMCRQLGLDWQRPVIATCGSGVTACVGVLALYELGNDQTAVYDGAWAEWGALADAPIA